MRYNISAKVTGNDKNLLKVFMTLFEKSYVEVAEKTAKQAATDMAHELRSRIENQRFRHQPLTPGYLQYKLMNHLDPRILIATGDYVNSIIPHRIRRGVWGVGVENRNHIDSDIPLRVLARWLEFGTSKSPARPHWRPMIAIWKASSARVAKRLRENLDKDLKHRIHQSRR